MICRECIKSDCLEETIQTFKDSTKHIRVQCLRCGIFVGYRAQSLQELEKLNPTQYAKLVKRQSEIKLNTVIKNSLEYRALKEENSVLKKRVFELESQFEQAMGIARENVEKRHVLEKELAQNEQH